MATLGYRHSLEATEVIETLSREFPSKVSETGPRGPEQETGGEAQVLRSGIVDLGLGGPATEKGLNPGRRKPQQRFEA